MREERSKTLRRRGRCAALLAGLLCLLLATTVLAAVNGLAQKSGTAGCISETASAGACADGTALDGTDFISISPDGANAYGTSLTSDAVTIFDRNPTTGTLTQKSGTAGCTSESGTGGACVDGKALNGALSVTVSPDGTNAYVASQSSDAVTIFQRDPGTGELTQKIGTGGCISEFGTGGDCVDGKALASAASVTVAPGGTSAYVASQISAAVAVFDRNPLSGTLTQKAGTAGCISESGTGGACADGTGLSGAFTVALSPNGASAYVASRFSDGVAVFDRDTGTGALTQKPAAAGCISETGAGGCTDGKGLVGAMSIVVSPDGASAYAASASSNAITIFDRDTTTGALTQKPGLAGCISETGSSGTCIDGSALSGVQSVTVSPDGTSVYAAALNDEAITIFDRNTTTGALTQKPGPAGCISDAGSSGTCVDGTALSGAASVAISPDGANAYAAAIFSSAVTIFDPDVPPETTIDSGPSGLSRDKTPSFTFSSSDANSTFECRVDMAAFTPCTGPGGAHTTAPLVDGSHTFVVRAVDPAATPDPSPATRGFSVDANAPNTEITRKPKKKTKTGKSKKKVSVSFRSEAGADFECRLDSKPYKPCASPFTVKAKSKAGKGKRHTISVRATDEAGNVESSAASVKFRLIRKR